MRTLFLLWVAAAAPGEPPAAAAARSATVETLPARGEAEIRTPEGFIRAEGPAAAGGRTGAFGVYAAGAYDRSRAPPPPGPEAGAGEAPPRAPEAGPARPARDPCRRERSRYLRRLLRASGIDLEEPLAVLDGLSGPGGHASALLFSAYGLLPGVDPIRPLAWDLELKGLARELGACAEAARASPP